jgi:hypothetical protein
VTRHQVADGEDDFKKCKVVANILHNQSWTADKGWSSGFEVGRRLTTSHRKTSMLRKVKEINQIEGV